MCQLYLEYTSAKHLYIGIKMSSRVSAHCNSRSFMNNNLLADQEIFQRSNLNNLKATVASKFMNISMLDIFNQVNYFIAVTMN